MKRKIGVDDSSDSVRKKIGITGSTVCPSCKESVNPDASRCPHCADDLWFCSECNSNVIPSFEWHRTSGWSWDESEMAFCTTCNVQIAGPKKSDCFIATAAYGTALAPEICILRETRDLHLQRFKIGRSFISVYETFSPAIAHLIRGEKFLMFTTRIILIPLILICSAINKFNHKNL